VSGWAGVVGIVVTVIAIVSILGGLTAGVGLVIQDSASSVHTEQLAMEFAGAIAPAETIGHTSTELTVDRGTIYTLPRQVRLLTGDRDTFEPGRSTVTVSEAIRSDAVIYARDTGRIVVHAGAAYYTDDDTAQTVRHPELITRGAETPVVVGIPAIQADDVGVSVSGQTAIRVETTVTHRHVDLGDRPAYLAIETTDPRFWQTYFADRSPTVVATRARFEGDQADSVIVRLPPDRPVTLVIHTVELAVDRT